MLKFFMGERWSQCRTFISFFYTWTIFAFPNRWTKIAERDLLPPFRWRSSFFGLSVVALLKRGGVLGDVTIAPSLSSLSSALSASIPELYGEEILNFLAPKCRASGLSEYCILISKYGDVTPRVWSVLLDDLTGWHWKLVSLTWKHWDTYRR